MRNILLHNPWVQFYLLYAGALWVVFIWDYLRKPLAKRDGGRIPTNEAVRWRAWPSFRPRSLEPCSVSRSGRRTDKEIGPHRG